MFLMMCFILLLTVAMAAEIMTFSHLFSNHCLGDKYFQPSYAVYKSYIAEKVESNRYRLTIKSCCKIESATLLVRTQTLATGSKCCQSYFFKKNFQYLSYNSVNLIFSEVLLFLNLFDGQLRQFGLRTSLREIY